jgi:thioredoxin reductase (NADPH)
MPDASFDVFVVGAGVAGLTAAEHVARSGLSVCISEEMLFGGLVLNVNHLQPGLEGLPGSGADLSGELMSRVTDLGATMLFEPVVGIEADAGGTWEVTTAGGAHSVRSVVVASGARLRQIGVPGESEFEGRGVSRCADCDAPMLHGGTAVVVGGGDSALQETLVLAEFCDAVHLVHRGGELRGRDDLRQAVREAVNVKLHLHTVVDAIVGDRAVTAVKLRDVSSGLTSELPCKGVFAYVGLEPNVGFLPEVVQRSSQGVRVNERLETSLPGVYAIGAVREGHAGGLTDAVRDARAVAKTIAERLARR